MITRREFVAATVVAASSGALARAVQPTTLTTAPQPAAAPQAKRAMRKALMIGMVGAGETVGDKFKILRDCGFEGVEMDSPTGLESDKIMKARDESGLVVHGVVDSVHWKYHLNNPDPQVRRLGIDGLKTAIRDAKAWGASSVLLVPAVVSKDLPYDQAWELSTAAIKECLPLAEELKVKIAVENVWNNFLLSPLEAASYVDSFGSPWVCFHLDLGNLEAFGWGEQWARILGKRVYKLHIKEYSRKKRNDEGMWKGFDVDLMEGDNNWAAIMKALDESGYTTGESRWATAEIRGGDANRLKEIAAKMDKIFAI